MADHPASSTHRDFAGLPGLGKPDLRVDYESAREQLERLLAEPVKDYPAIDELVDRLERLQLAIKAEHGIKGNNPNE